MRKITSNEARKQIDNGAGFISCISARQSKNGSKVIYARNEVVFFSKRDMDTIAEYKRLMDIQKEEYETIGI